MTIDRAVFTESLAKKTAAGEITEDQATIANIMLDLWQERAPEDYRWLAYIMATAGEDPALVDTSNPAGSCEKVMRRMMNGEYTGRGLSEFFNDNVCDWNGARVVVDLSGADAEKVANWAIGFYAALNEASNISLPSAEGTYEQPAPPVEDETRRAKDADAETSPDDEDDDEDDETKGKRKRR